MIVKTRIFEFYDNGDNGYRNLSELAKAMGISVSQIYRVREGKRQINQKFIVGAMKAFPIISSMTFFILLQNRHLSQKAGTVSMQQHLKYAKYDNGRKQNSTYINNDNQSIAGDRQVQ